MAGSADHRGGRDAAGRPSARQGSPAAAATFHLSTGPVPHRPGERRAGIAALVHVIEGRVREPAGGLGRVLERGAIALFDCTGPRRPWISDGSVLTVDLEGSALAGQDWPDGRRDVLVLPRAGADLLNDMLGSMARHAADLTVHQAVAATATIGTLLRDALEAGACGAVGARPAPHPDRVRRILAFIDANVSRVDLSPDTIAAATGVSRSVLYRLLETVGGVAACVKQRRLAAMHRALGQGDDPRSIAEIAAASGFQDPSHAHRNFREAFGVTPGDVRRDGRDPSAAAAEPPRAGRRIRRRSAVGPG